MCFSNLHMDTFMDFYDEIQKFSSLGNITAARLGFICIILKAFVKASH